MYLQVKNGRSPGFVEWVGQAWRALHSQHTSTIRQTFRNLGLSLAVDGSEDEEIKVKDIPGLEVGDWRVHDDQEDIQEMEEVDMEAEGVEGNHEDIQNAEREFVFEDELEEEEIDEESSDEEIEKDSEDEKD